MTKGDEMTTGKVVFDITMSLDGFIAGPNDEIDPLHDWIFTGDTSVDNPGNEEFKLDAASAAVLEDALSAGAVVVGRRMFDVSGAWGGNPTIDVPYFVVTHNIPEEWAGEGSPFTFVTDGVESAIAQASAAAGDKNVYVGGGADIAQQAIAAGVVDEIQLHVAPVLLGKGIRLFDNLGSDHVTLEIVKVVETPRVTHLRYRIVK